MSRAPVPRRLPSRAFKARARSLCLRCRTRGTQIRERSKDKVEGYHLVLGVVDGRVFLALQNEWSVGQDAVVRGASHSQPEGRKSQIKQNSKDQKELRLLFDRSLNSYPTCSWTGFDWAGVDIALWRAAHTKSNCAIVTISHLGTHRIIMNPQTSWQNALLYHKISVDICKANRRM